VHGRTQSFAFADSTLDQELDALLVSGGDERLTLDVDGRNKYHLDPRTSAGVFQRGSCTCSPLNDGGRRAAAHALARLRSGDVDFTELLFEQRVRLSKIFLPGPHGEADVIFAPSGSDLCYLPLLFSSVVDPGRRIVNVVATSEELGSGSLLAHDARFFAAETQIGEGCKIGDPVTARLDVESVFLPARDDQGGIVDQGREIERLIAARDVDDVLIINLVIGSKSGIENGVRIVERFGTDDIIWTVDLCQMRARPALFEHLLGLGCLLLCTGSKFYEAPPFCGAMLVPEVWMKRLAAADVAPPAGFHDIFSMFDFPPALALLAMAFPAVENVGLSLRWEAALTEMEAFDDVPVADSAAAIASWHDCVIERIKKSCVLELLGDQEQTNDSIVSFRIRTADGGYLDHEELAEVHRRLAADGAPEILPYRRATIGQPVAYPTGSFLRLALGSSDVRRAVASGFDAACDLALIAAVEQTAGQLR
jgi:hypothetical protein